MPVDVCSWAENTWRWFSFSRNWLIRQEIGLKLISSNQGGVDSVRSSVKLSKEGPTRQTCCPLKDEGQDGRAQRRVITEFLQVAAVLPFGPNGHLDETHQCEEGHRHTLSHDREAQPGAQLQERTVNTSTPIGTRETTTTEHTLPRTYSLDRTPARRSR